MFEDLHFMLLPLTEGNKNKIEAMDMKDLRFAGR
jgi:hypothetical protein